MGFSWDMLRLGKTHYLIISSNLNMGDQGYNLERVERWHTKDEDVGAVLLSIGDKG